jgi:hypothetical protein
MKLINLVTEVPKLAAKGDYAGIVKLYKAVQLQVPATERKDHQAICLNLAKAYAAMRNYRQAEDEYAAAFAILPDKNLLYYLSIMQLHNGNITDGFRNYGYRWLSDEMQPYYQALRTKGVPYLYNWSELTGKRVLVTGEQGFGDELMFGRAVHEAAKHTQSMTRLCPEQLAAFFAHNLPGTNLSIKKPSELPPEFISENFDTIVTVGDLFMFYVLEYGKLPPVPKYTAPNPAYIDGRRPKIGFVYSPGALGDNANERAINPKMFRPFMKDYDFHSFQVGAPRVIGTDHSPYINSFADTADLLDGMDCAVTCDTAFAHLALCMGKPTLLVYDKYVDWRFKVGMYPAAKLLSMTDRDFDKKFHDFVGGTK